MLEDSYYVYAYLDPRKEGKYIYGDVQFNFEPFYIGKGSGDRKLFHLKEAKRKRVKDKNKYKINKIKSILNDGLTPIIIELINTYDEEKAFEVERRLIEAIGRKDIDNSKPLLNLSDGGEGSSGHTMSKESKEALSRLNKGFKHSEETKQRMRESHKGSKNWIYGIGHSDKTKEVISKKAKERCTPEFRKKMSESQKGKTLSAEHKRSISESSKGNKGGSWVITNDLGEEFVVLSLRDFCDKSNINYSSMYYHATKSKKPYKGWSARPKED